MAHACCCSSYFFYHKIQKYIEKNRKQYLDYSSTRHWPVRDYALVIDYTYVHSTVRNQQALLALNEFRSMIVLLDGKSSLS